MAKLHREIAVHEAGHMFVGFYEPGAHCVRLHCDADGWRITTEPPFLGADAMLRGLVAGGVMEAIDRGATPETWEDVMANSRFANLDNETLQTMMGAGMVSAAQIDVAVAEAVAVLSRDDLGDIDALHGCMECMAVGTFSEFGKVLMQ